MAYNCSICCVVISAVVKKHADVCEAHGWGSSREEWRAVRDQICKLNKPDWGGECML